jgi:DNA-binding NarL/FixJ family response regulator
LDHVRRTEHPQELDASSLDSLSARELEVLRLISQGQENAEIALELGISARTAKNHVSSILAKLGLGNRVQAAVFAAQHGLL